jgi:hypothetical protein
VKVSQLKCFLILYQLPLTTIGLLSYGALVQALDSSSDISSKYETSGLQVPMLIPAHHPILLDDI